MADSKITALTSISTSTDPAVDPLVIVDVSDTSMAATGTTKKVTLNNLLSSSPTASGALTVTGLVTAGSATITGALTVDTTTLVANAAGYADRVGIGTATPGYPLEVVGNAVFSADATCKRFFVNDTTGNGNAYINGANGSQSVINLGGQTNYNYGAIIYDDASNFLAFRTNGAEAARFNSTGNLVLKGGTAAANGVGVTFPATPVASSDANCLDDYKEGTFTATLNSGTFTSQVFKYTKIGNMVTVFFDVIVGTGGGDRITNLPYTAGGTVANGIYTNAQDYAAGTTSPVVVVGASGTIMYFRTVGDNVAFSAMTLTAAAALSGSISYFV